MAQTQEEIEFRVTRIEKGHQRLSDSITCMKESIEKYGGLLEDIHVVVQKVKGFASVLKWISTTFIFVGKYLVAPLVALALLSYMLTHDGHVPTWWHDFLTLK